MWMDRGKEGAKKGDFSTFWQTLIPPFGFLSWPKSPACTYVHRNGQKRRRRRRRNLFKNFVRSSSHHYFDVLHLSLSLCTLDTLGTKGIGKKGEWRGVHWREDLFGWMRKGRRWKKKSAANWLWARHTQVSLYPSEIDCPKTSRTQRFFSATETTPPRRGTSSFILYLLFFLLPCTFQLSCGSPLHKSVRHSGQEKTSQVYRTEEEL